jgi:hypothetical protein
METEPLAKRLSPMKVFPKNLKDDLSDEEIKGEDSDDEILLPSGSSPERKTNESQQLSSSEPSSIPTMS